VRNLSAFSAGLLFGVGLWLSGMANPKKVLDFLDITGAWDPSLALVMGGAVAVTLVSFRKVIELKGMAFERKSVDLPLVIGAAIFGIGWGIGGYCPGPAVTALATLSTGTFVFVGAMIAGGVLAGLLVKFLPSTGRGA
jgi:uncharacterized membrane protein YedE/YeeE